MARARACRMGGYSGSESVPSPNSSQGSCSPLEDRIHLLDTGRYDNEGEDMAFPARMYHAPVIDDQLEDTQTRELVSPIPILFHCVQFCTDPFLGVVSMHWTVLRLQTAIKRSGHWQKLTCIKDAGSGKRPRISNTTTILHLAIRNHSIRPLVKWCVHV